MTKMSEYLLQLRGAMQQNQPGLLALFEPRRVCSPPQHRLWSPALSGQKYRVQRESPTGSHAPPRPLAQRPSNLSGDGPTRRPSADCDFAAPGRWHHRLE